MKIINNQLINHIIKYTIIALFVLVVLGAIAGPLTSLIASNLKLASLFEFYLIYVLLKDSKHKVSFSHWGRHIVEDLSDLVYFSLSIGIYVFSASTVFVSLWYSLEATSSVLTIASAIMVLKTYVGMQLLLIFLAFITDKPIYEYLGLTPIACSVMFAVLTDLAASYIAATPVLAGLLYFASLIPLLYFLSVAKDNVDNQKTDDNSWSNTLNNTCYTIGSLSLIIHIVEAAFFTASLFFPAARVYADVIRHPVTQTALNATTTVAAGAKFTNLLNMFDNESVLSI